MVKNSQYIESWSNRYTNFIRATGKLQPSGFSLRFPFYVQSPNDAYLLLSETENPLAEEDVYEIQLGAVGNSVVRIMRKKSGVVLNEIKEEFILNEFAPMKFVVEVSLTGTIRVYSELNPWAPLLTATDLKPLNVKYLSFASSSRSLFFYDVNEKIWLHDERDKGEPAKVVEEVKKPNPLISIVEVPSGKEDVWFNKYFKIYDTLGKKDYENLINLEELESVKPEGYHVRMPIWVEGPHNAHILLSPSGVPSMNDDAYEIIIGGWMNSRVEIRKRWNGPVIASVSVPNVMSLVKRRKFVIEVSHDGWINLFSDHDLYKPLISAYDPVPVHVNWLGFKNKQGVPVKFYYDYQPKLDNKQILSNLLPAKYDLDELKTQCTTLVAEGSGFKKFAKISDLSLTRIDNMGKTFSFYVDGTKDASIVLSASEHPNPEVDDVYEVCKYFYNGECSEGVSNISLP